MAFVNSLFPMDDVLVDIEGFRRINIDSSSPDFNAKGSDSKYNLNLKKVTLVEVINLFILGQ